MFLRAATTASKRVVRVAQPRVARTLLLPHATGARLAFPGSVGALDAPRRAHSTPTSYSSFAEPDPTLFADVHASAAPTDTPLSLHHDAPLRADIRVMGSVLGQVICQHEGQAMFDHVEHMRSLAKAWRSGTADTMTTSTATTRDDAAFASLSAHVQALSTHELYQVARAFTHFLSIANAAERHHRSRRLRQAPSVLSSASGALWPKTDSCGGVIPDLVQQGHSPEAIWQVLSTQTTELVLTAHPTERRIQDILTQADVHRTQTSHGGAHASPYDLQQLDNAMYREISNIWQSDEVSRFKPTPVQEAEKGTLVVETVLWEAVPQFVRKLDATSREYLHRGIPLDAAPIRFASWMGGDRDGNPNVTPPTTRQVCLANRRKAALLFGTQLQRLERELSITTCSDELRNGLPSTASHDDQREPYRAYLRPMLHKLHLTQVWANQELDQLLESKEVGSAPSRSGPVRVSTQDIYLDKDEFRNDLMVMYRSLCSTGNEMTADGTLTDIIRNVSAFGLTLVPLDVRQEADRHEEALDAITRFLGLGSYAQWDEESKIAWLTSQIASRRPLLRSGVWKDHGTIFSPTAQDTLETFAMIADQHEDSLGAYVISQAKRASDVLAVVLLQLDAGVTKPLRVAPLFESLEDLNGAAATMKQLFALPVYMGLINGQQEVMIGYSDSAKDAGRLAASWAQYETQEELAQLAREHNVAMTFFHGKGGTVGRGGNPQTFLAIMAHAPQTINGRFRVTEQGEMINQNLGYHDRAERTMDIYTAAVLADKLTERTKPPDSWRDMMRRLSSISCDAYRRIVREDPRFVPYFRAATPELELSGLNIGSRPAKRKAGGGVESLRAIPWIFAWTQTRLNLPTWLGVGEAVSEILSSDKAPLLREMYRDWGSFRMMIDLVEMVLAKSEPAIAKHYEDMLVTEAQATELGREVRSIHLNTEKAILSLTEHQVLGENNPILMRALQVRNPYVDCLNVLQAETLKRIRESDAKENKILQDALMTTITGLANGMGNTG